MEAFLMKRAAPSSAQAYKGTGLHELLRPSFMKNSPDFVQLNGELNRIVMAVGYPRTIREGWLDRIVSSSGNFDMSMHIAPSAVDAVLTRLNHELIKQEADLLSAQANGIPSPSLRIQRDDTLKVLERLQKGEEKLFRASLYLNARAFSKENLEKLCSKVLSDLNSIMIIPKIPFLRMAEALKSMLPLQEDRLGIGRDITSNALSACFPFTTAFFDPGSDGIMLGFNRASGVPVVIDHYGLPNHNGLILGTSGGGKSFAAKLFAIRNILAGTKTVIIDPQGEYREMAGRFGGKVVGFGEKGTAAINPFDLNGMQVEEKVPMLVEFLRILLGGITAEQEVFLANALPKLYRKKAVISSKGKKALWSNKDVAGADSRLPMMRDLYAEVIATRKASKAGERYSLEHLEARLRPLVKGGCRFLDSDTTVSMDSPVLCFNIAEVQEKLKPALMFLIMDHVHRTMRASRERKLLLIDEAWSLLKFGETAEHIFGLIKTARKFGLSVVIITQEAEDLIYTGAGKAVLANTAWKFLARQEPAVINDLAKKFKLNREERNLLLTAMPGEGLLFSLNDHIPLKVVASPQEYRMVTTKPEEISGFRAQGWREYSDKDGKDNDNCANVEGKAQKQNQDQTPYGHAAHDPEKAALLRLVEEEIRKYTDSVSVQGQAKIGAACEPGQPDIIFHSPGSNNGDAYEMCGVIVADYEAEGQNWTLPEIHGGRRFREVFVLVNEASAKPALMRPFSAVTFEEFMDRLKVAFGG